MNIEKYKKDIEQLVEVGQLLYNAVIFELYPEERKNLEIPKGKKLPKFALSYQSWYSEALSVIRQLLPDRVTDFASYYTPSKARKELSWENYTVSDYLRGLVVTHPIDDRFVVEPKAAVKPLLQQLSIVLALQSRFESSLFDIGTLVQADLFDNELDTASELNRKGFARAAGAVAGVVLEGHLKTVAKNHKVQIHAKATLGALMENLKANNVLDQPEWRFIQHLTDLRNLCDHKSEKSPTKDNIDDLISGVRKITKTVL